MPLAPVQNDTSTMVTTSLGQRVHVHLGWHCTLSRGSRTKDGTAFSLGDLGIKDGIIRKSRNQDARCKSHFCPLFTSIFMSSYESIPLAYKHFGYYSKEKHLISPSIGLILRKSFRAFLVIGKKSELVGHRKISFIWPSFFFCLIVLANLQVRVLIH